LSVITNPVLGALPPPWADADVGTPGLAGSASFNAGVFSISGSGSDIYNASDQFHFAYQPATGDMTLTAQVTSLQSANAWSKSGVMLRETTTSSSKYVGLYLTTSNGISMQYRSGTGSNAVDLARATGLVAPYWVRLVRAGDTFTGYRAQFGTNWTQVGSIAFTMSTNQMAGLAVCSHDNTRLNSSAFANVSIIADSDGDGIPDAWMWQYFGHPTGLAGDHSRAADDADGDGMSNLAEYLAGTNPTNAASNLRMLGAASSGNDVLLSWTVAGGRSYVVQAATGLSGASTFADISPEVAVPGSGESVTNYVDVGGLTNALRGFYRVRLGP
jgi:hypothetical protein